MITLQSSYPEAVLFLQSSGQKLPSGSFIANRGSRIMKPSERSYSVTNRPHRLKSKQFQLSNPEKIIAGLQITSLNQPNTSKNIKEIRNLGEQLHEVVGDLDRHMLKVLHKQETNFLTAYKGVMRQIAVDLNKYKAELQRYATESKESENQHLKNAFVAFEQQVSQLFTMTKKFEEQNRDLKKKIIDLNQDLKSEKELNLTLGLKNRVHQELARTLVQENRQVILSSTGIRDKSIEQIKEGGNLSLAYQEGANEEHCKTDINELKEQDDNFLELLAVTSYRAGTPVLITANDPSRRSLTSRQKQSRPVSARLDNNAGLKDKMHQLTPNDSSINTRSVSPQEQKPRELESRGFLKLSLKSLLKPNLKADVDLDDMVELILSNIERCIQNNNHGVETRNSFISQRNINTVMATTTPKMDEFEYLKTVLGDCLEEALKKTSINPPASYKSRPKSSNGGGHNRQMVELFLKEKEINKIIASTFDTTRSDKRVTETSEHINLQGMNTLETEKNYEDTSLISDDEIEPKAHHFSFINRPMTEGNSKVKKLNLGTLSSKESSNKLNIESRRPKSGLTSSRRSNVTTDRGGNNTYRHHSLSEREKARESLSLTTLLNIKKDVQLNTEPDYVSSHPMPEFSNNSEVRKSKSPTRGRIVMHNGKLYMRDISPVSANKIN